MRYKGNTDVKKKLLIVSNFLCVRIIEILVPYATHCSNFSELSVYKLHTQIVQVGVIFSERQS